MAIVYRHRRLDNGKVFYIGIGKNTKRSTSKFSRNPYWHSIVNKSGFKSEILYKDISWEDACELEEFLISLYGRKDLKRGYLANMTNGGEGMSNPIKHPRERKVYQFTLQGKYIRSYRNSVIASEVNNSQPSRIRECCNGTTNYVSGYKYSYTKKVVTLKTSIKDTPVNQICSISNTTLRSWSSVEEATTELGIDKYLISRVCNGVRKTAGGYIWKYKL